MATTGFFDGLDLPEVVDDAVYQRAVARFRDNGIVLPTLAELAAPSAVADKIAARAAGVDRNAADPGNLWRVHWYNDRNGGMVDVPDHVVLPPELTGVEAPIIVAFGNRFPMIGAHKVLAAYACLVPRLITGRFDPTANRAIWPSTGNYARGGVAISRIMGCRGVAVLPENMSAERFEWLERWIEEPDDVIRTYGSESNVKEIYDACHELAKDDRNVILNQFNEYANHVGHYAVTGAALGDVFTTVAATRPGLELAAFVSASGSAGTLGAGDRLKDDFGARIVAVEALECPTMLYNGYGEHNIQGIGDKHIPLIHNVMNTDVVVGISDQATNELSMVFNTDVGKKVLVDRYGVDRGVIDTLVDFGFSSICNTLAAIKTAKQLDLGADQAIITVATDGSELYNSEMDQILASRYGGAYSEADATEAFGRHMVGADSEHLEELDAMGRQRVFNLGYYTWVEQQGTSIEHFDARRSQDFWRGWHDLVPVWDEMIERFNAATGLQ